MKSMQHQHQGGTGTGAGAGTADVASAEILVDVAGRLAAAGAAGLAGRADSLCFFCRASVRASSSLPVARSTHQSLTVTATSNSHLSQPAK